MVHNLQAIAAFLAVWDKTVFTLSTPPPFFSLWLWLLNHCRLLLANWTIRQNILFITARYSCLCTRNRYITRSLVHNVKPWSAVWHANIGRLLCNYTWIKLWISCDRMTMICWVGWKRGTDHYIRGIYIEKMCILTSQEELLHVRYHIAGNIHWCKISQSYLHTLQRKISWF